MSRVSPRIIDTEARTLDDALDALGQAQKTSIAKGTKRTAGWKRKQAATMSEKFNRRPVYLKKPFDAA